MITTSEGNGGANGKVLGHGGGGASYGMIILTKGQQMSKMAKPHFWQYQKIQSKILEVP